MVLAQGEGIEQRSPCVDIKLRFSFSPVTSVPKSRPSPLQSIELMTTKWLMAQAENPHVQPWDHSPPQQPQKKNNNNNNNLYGHNYTVDFHRNIFPVKMGNIFQELKLTPKHFHSSGSHGESLVFFVSTIVVIARLGQSWEAQQWQWRRCGSSGGAVTTVMAVAVVVT